MELILLVSGVLCVSMILAGIVCKWLFTVDWKKYNTKCRGTIIDVSDDWTYNDLAGDDVIDRHEHTYSPIIEIEYMHKIYKTSSSILCNKEPVIGSQLEVWIDPENPTKCYLDGDAQKMNRKANILYWIFMLFGIISGILFVLTLIAVVWN